jgi:hypothetical protein
VRVDSLNPILDSSTHDVSAADRELRATIAPGGLGEILRIFLAAALFLGITVMLQWLSGAYSAGFAGPDEPSHFVNGLMVHDYLHHWPPAHPVQFAEEYYLHYPEVSVGHWPPLFYIVQGVWMSLTSQTRVSVLALMALFTALLGFTTYRFIRLEFGEAAGLCAGALVICVPLVQKYSSQVMAEVPVALFCLWATLAFGRYIETGKWQFSAWFGVLAACAILTKGTGIAVVLVVLALVPLRGIKWFGRGSFWIAPAVLIGLCGLWYLFTLNMARNGWEEKPGLAYMLKALPWNARQVAGILGMGLFPVVIIGLAARITRPSPARGRWVSLALLLVGVCLFQSIVPASLAQRHLLTTAAPLVMFLVAGAAWLAARVRIGTATTKTKFMLITGLILTIFAVTTFRIAKFNPGPFGPAVEDLLARSDLHDAVFLVSSQSYGEGRFIAQLAMRESRPGHVILRGSKMLAEGDWSGRENTLLFSSADAAMHFLDSIPVSILVLHSQLAGPVHLDYTQLVELIGRYPAVWQCIGTYATQYPSNTREEVRVYRNRNRGGPQAGKIRIDLHRMLGRSIER